MDQIQEFNDYRAKMNEVILGKHPGRTSDAEVTWFKSLGMAVEDVVAADLVLKARGR